MELTIEELLKGKATKIKEKEFYPTEAYVTPFLERLQKLTTDFRIKAELPKQVTITKKDDINFDDVTYNRVWIQAVLPETVYNHSEVIGMVYGIDTRKPICKFYKGGLNMVCTNLCVFNPLDLRVQEFSDKVDYRSLDYIVDRENELKKFLDSLFGRVFPLNTINENLGKWVKNCINLKYDNGITKASMSTSVPISVYKLLFKDTKSPYYVNNDTDYFKVYNAFTDILSNKENDIINSVDKTLLLRNILEL